VTRRLPQISHVAWPPAFLRPRWRPATRWWPPPATSPARRRRGAPRAAATIAIPLTCWWPVATTPSCRSGTCSTSAARPAPTGRCTTPTWGRVKAVTHPAVGDNEYSGNGCSTAGASGYFGYFGSAATPRQPSCRTACGGYYSYDLGTWRIVVLNTECSKPGVGGCTSSSPQGRWLAADLAANPSQCTLAYWHRPRWQDNGRTSGSSSYFVQALHNAGAEVILNGHEHLYERFAPQTPAGVAAPDGIRQFTVGTGGQEPPRAERHSAPQRPGPQLQRLRGAGPDAAPDQLRLAVRVRGGPDLHRLGQPPLPLGRRPAHRRAGPCPA
jgi:hypothetical protein